MTEPAPSLSPAARSTCPPLVSGDSATRGSSGDTLVAGGCTSRRAADGLPPGSPDGPPSLDYFVNKERARETHFLQSMIVRWDCPCAMELSRRLALARHEGRVLRRAVLMAVVIGSLAVSALGYAALLAPDLFVRHPGSFLTAEALSMASLVSVAGFMAYLYWIGAVSNTLHEECRQYLLHRSRSQTIDPRHSETRPHGTMRA